MIETPQGEVDRFRQQYAEIAMLAGGLAHEIKNPLSTIGLNLEIMADDVAELDERARRRLLPKLQMVQRECRRLDDILNAFLQFARAGELQLEPTDLNRVVRDFVEFFQPRAREAQVDVSPHLATDLPPVLLDRALMQQVLLNLAINAQQAMPQGGQLELQTYVRDGRVHLDLIDTGVGMDATTLGKIFQVFYSTKPAGSGLGLPTVRKIIEAHRGSIICESAPGRGTRFTIGFPPASEASDHGAA